MQITDQELQAMKAEIDSLMKRGGTASMVNTLRLAQHSTDRAVHHARLALASGDGHEAIHAQIAQASADTARAYLALVAAYQADEDRRYAERW